MGGCVAGAAGARRLPFPVHLAASLCCASPLRCSGSHSIWRATLNTLEMGSHSLQVWQCGWEKEGSRAQTSTVRTFIYYYVALRRGIRGALATQA